MICAEMVNSRKVWSFSASLSTCQLDNTIKKGKRKGGWRYEGNIELARQRKFFFHVTSCIMRIVRPLLDTFKCFYFESLIELQSCDLLFTTYLYFNVLPARKKCPSHPQKQH